MDPTGSGFPRRRWELSAPESQVLLTGSETADDRVLTLALLELVVRRVLLLVEVRDRVLIFPRRRIAVVRDEGVPAPSNPVLLRVLDAYGSPRRFADGTSGTTVRTMVKRLRASDRAKGGFVPAVVLSALDARGYFRSESYDRLGIFPRTRWTITGQGIDALSELSQVMDTGRGAFNVWLATDPERAAAFIEDAGPAVLLLDVAGVSMHMLQRSLTTFPLGSALAGPPAEPRQRWPSAGNLFEVATLSGHFGPGAFDGLDAAYRAIEVEVGRALSSGSGGGGE